MVSTHSLRVGFHTLGCKLNQSETEAIQSAFSLAGFSLAGTGGTAGLFIVNTCTVTSKSEQKARRIIRRIASANPRALILVCGCYAELDPQKIRGLSLSVFPISKIEKQKLPGLPDYLAATLRQGLPARQVFSIETIENYFNSQHSFGDSGPFIFFDESATERSRAFLKIQDGCDNRCAYCRVPLARGDSVSIPAETALQRARRLIAAGYREIVLTGVNISLYRNGSRDLCGLLSYLLAHTEECRFRLSSIEPEAIDRSFAEVCADPRICPHFHLPVQSGSDRILALSGRRYRADQVREAVALLRAYTVDPFIGVDIIVGLPGESLEDFMDTEALIRDFAFSGFHVFPYSPRPGTAAPGIKGHVPERKVKERLEHLKPATETLEREYIERQAGRQVRIIAEDSLLYQKKRYIIGLSENYLSVLLPDMHSECGERQVKRREAVDCRISRIDKGRIFADPC